eukprot:gene1687-12750_t
MVFPLLRGDSTLSPSAPASRNFTTSGKSRGVLMFCDDATS